MSFWYKALLTGNLAELLNRPKQRDCYLFCTHRVGTPELTIQLSTLSSLSPSMKEQEIIIFCALHRKVSRCGCKLGGCEASSYREKPVCCTIPNYVVSKLYSPDEHSCTGA